MRPREPRHGGGDFVAVSYSGNCQEEAIICKVLDMGDRKRRLIPLVIEPVSMPAWLYGIVGIDATKANPLVDPFEKLKSTLGPPLAKYVERRVRRARRVNASRCDRAQGLPQRHRVGHATTSDACHRRPAAASRTRRCATRWLLRVSVTLWFRLLRASS